MEQLTSRQLSEWEAYDRLDPIGEWREDFRIAALETAITNLAIKIHGKKSAKLADVEDFMPNWDREEKPEPRKQSPEEIKRFFLAFADMHNERYKRTKIVANKLPKERQPYKHYGP